MKWCARSVYYYYHKWSIPHYLSPLALEFDIIIVISTEPMLAWLFVVFVFIVIALFLLFGYVLQTPSLRRRSLAPNISFGDVGNNAVYGPAIGEPPPIPILTPPEPSHATSHLLPLYSPATYARWFGTNNGPRVFIFHQQ